MLPNSMHSIPQDLVAWIISSGSLHVRKHQLWMLIFILNSFVSRTTLLSGFDNCHADAPAHRRRDLPESPPAVRLHRHAINLR